VNPKRGHKSLDSIVVVHGEASRPHVKNPWSVTTEQIQNKVIALGLNIEVDLTQHKAVEQLGDREF
jgi:hypothetical protein